jgi:hypothetical protein
MTTFTRNTLAFAIVMGFAMPAVASQSANRTGSGVANPPQAVGTLAPESQTAGRCRQHCASLTAAAPHQPHRNVAENQVKAATCFREMAK